MQKCNYFLARHSVASSLATSPIALFFLVLFLLTSLPYLAWSQAVQKGIVPVTPPLGNLHIDGDLRARTPLIDYGDWLPQLGSANLDYSVFTADGQPKTANSTTTFHVVDSYTSGDNTFEGGLKKNTNLNLYKWKYANPSPGKCDINNYLMHIAEDGSTGDTWISLSGDRESTNGNSFISISLHQAQLSMGNGNFITNVSDATGGRTPGDVQISAEFTGGGSNPNLYLEEWRAVNGVYQWVAFQLPAGKILGYGSTNDAVITDVPYDVFGKSSYSINSFIEVSFNVTEIFKNTSVPCVGSIKSVFVMTKSSQSVTADLADFVTPIDVDLDISVGAPIASGASYCVGNPVADLTVSGENGATFNWYNTGTITDQTIPVGTGSTFASGVNSAVAGTTNFWVTQTLKG